MIFRRFFQNLLVPTILFLAFCPLMKADASTFVSENITSNTNWNINGSPYVIENTISVSSGITLTIDPGVVVKFLDGVSLGVFGNIKAQDGESIVFTSYYDDDYGGDTDFDDDPIEDIEASPNDWQGIYFLPGSEGSDLSDVLFRYSSTALSVNGSDIKFGDLFIENCINGIIVSNSSISFQDINLSNVESSGVLGYGSSSVSIKDFYTNSTFSPITFYDHAVASFLNISIENSENVPISLFNNSTLEVDELNIYNSKDSGAIEIFDNSNLLANTIDISDVGSSEAIILFGNSFLSSKSTNIRNGDYGIILFDGSILDISNGEISGFTYSAIEDYGSDNTYGENDILLNSIEIKNNDVGISIFSDMSIYKSSKVSIYENNSFGVFSPSNTDFDFINIWWGDPSGPFNPTYNIEGLGNSVSDNILFIPFLNSPPSSRIPLIIIPGMAGSYLFEDFGSQEEIWPSVYRVVFSLADQFLDVLALNNDGTESLNTRMKIGDIIRYVEVQLGAFKRESHVFDYFIDYFTSNGYTENENLFVFPYDWRFSNVKTAELLNEKINEVLNATGASKVNLASHSMGGIVAKTYVRGFGSEKVENIVFMGTPHLGAPKGAKTLLYGDDMGFNIFDNISLLNQNKIKEISRNMASIYELVPSRKYISEAGEYLHVVNNGVENPLSYSESTDFFFASNLNQAMYTQADSLHQDIDDLDFENIKVSNISSCGMGTIAKIRVRPEINIGPLSFTKDYDVQFTNGDGTVPVGSANSLNIGDNYFVNGTTHAEIPSSSNVPTLVFNILNDGDKSEFSKDFISCHSLEGDVISKHSPIDLHIFDEEGNHSGPDEYGNIENNIDGVVYETIEDTSFVFLPDGREYEIFGQGTDEGDFDLVIENIKGNDIISTTYWSNVPINESSQIQLSVNSGNYSPIYLDQNGDDEYEDILDDPDILGERESYLENFYDENISECVDKFDKKSKLNKKKAKSKKHVLDCGVFKHKPKKDKHIKKVIRKSTKEIFKKIKNRKNKNHKWKNTRR